MTTAKTIRFCGLAMAVLALGVSIACTTSSDSYPTQPPARNVIPGIVTGPVEAGFAWQVDGVDILKVVFQDLSTGEVETWQWDFGDGRGSSAQNPTHGYKAAGTYLVVLTVSNLNQRSSTSQFVQVGEESEPSPTPSPEGD